VRGYYSDADGRLMSAPFNSSTAICWYNKDAFEKAGLDPEVFPTTWPELVSLARTIRDRQAAQYPVITASVVWAHFEQFSAIHNLPYATEANGFKGYGARLQIDSAAHIRNLRRLLDMSKEATFHYTGRDGSGDGAFVAGQAAIDFSSSALRGLLASDAKFRWAAALLPYDPEVIRQPINSVIGGASLWVLTAPGRGADEYRGAAEFLRFLAQPDNDAEWSEVTGYVPITHAGFDVVRQQGWFAGHPGADLPVRQLSRGEVTDNSRGFHLGRMPELRTIIEEECEQALVGQQSARAALHNAVARGNLILRDFQHSVGG
jgi:sn-glycerol 3-phosphate transport system substrate-binding protein